MKLPSRMNLRSKLDSGSSARGSRVLRSAAFVWRLLQFCSSVIVIAIASYFIRDYNQAGEHIYYQEVISTTSAGFFLGPLILSFWNKLTWHLLPLDLVYSYLWLTAFVFAAEDYNFHSCSTGPPSTLSSCKKKWVLEAFIFLSFIFTFFNVCFQLGIWARESSNRTHTNEKSSETENGVTNGHDQSATTNTSTA